ncbi:ABC transporter ATP-binding protein [Mycolicibacterium goodii]|uniref:ABC transporter ATP-binding protein n=1 Tax=Mycolicibacterium goodii TaxID=134601 RepID=UPI00093EF806|nr:ABC transporter ATP-binding protein [Mycolicibacterium goodii]MBU8829675.1 ABC transporter ATP-binding protein [Mycolicibacterium goodii]OKH70532.1 iron ABC transporter ATPase [Mycobacterium sp. SWH-M5]
MLEVQNLVKSFDGESLRRRVRKDRSANETAPARVFAVNNVSFEVKPGELFTLLGPSGCGKSTTLRSIAGLEQPDSGVVTVGGTRLFAAGADVDKRVNVPANKRGLGMVFQSYAIWPHMTVFENVAFPLRVRSRKHRPGKREITERVQRVLETMELLQYADRHATKLSGGQQQRLALARAMVVEPALLLLDEPLSNLDAKLRESLRFELKRLQRELGITSIYVTHDQIEALSLSSSIAVMRAGEVVQLGKPRDIYENPQSKFVAEFIGTSNFIDGTVKTRDGDRHVVETRDGRLTLDAAAHVPPGTEVVVSIRPEAVMVTADRPGDAVNVWEGTVTTRAFLGDAVDHVVAVGKNDIRARCLPHISHAPGSAVYLQMDPGKLSLVPVD